MRECEEKKNSNPRDSTPPQIHIFAGFIEKNIEITIYKQNVILS